VTDFSTVIERCNVTVRIPGKRPFLAKFDPNHAEYIHGTKVWISAFRDETSLSLSGDYHHWAEVKLSPDQVKALIAALSKCVEAERT
jgi:hypothetical protein